MPLLCPCIDHGTRAPNFSSDQHSYRLSLEHHYVNQFITASPTILKRPNEEDSACPGTPDVSTPHYSTTNPSDIADVTNGGNPYEHSTSRDFARRSGLLSMTLLHTARHTTHHIDFSSASQTNAYCTEEVLRRPLLLNFKSSLMIHKCTNSSAALPVTSQKFQ